MNYNQAYECIEEWNKLGSVPGLDSITELCKRLGNPQDELKFIHIAGTNGKGSILCYISTILNSLGYKTGCYVSPTISTYLERFQVNGKYMSKAAFARYVERIKNVCDEMVSEGLPHPTSFEVETAIAFMYFLDKKCDIVVLECGMGGKLDATNLVTTSLMEVFAHIDMDHMQFLGQTQEDIAREKAGIIKPGTMVVSMPQKEEVSAVLREVAKANNCNYVEVSPEEISSIKYSLKGQSFMLDGAKFTTPLLGTHQIDNAATAVRAIQILGARGIIKNATKENIQKGLAQAVWPARLSIVSKKPLIVIDGAHNPDAARRLSDSVDLYFADKRKIFIMGMFRDKAVEEVAGIMCGKADMVLTIATPNNPRALSSVELAGIVAEVNPNVTSLDSVEEAIEMAKMFADDNTLILAFGSLSFLGRIMDICK